MNLNLFKLILENSSIEFINLIFIKFPSIEYLSISLNKYPILSIYPEFSEFILNNNELYNNNLNWIKDLLLSLDIKIRKFIINLIKLKWNNLEKDLKLLNILCQIIPKMLEKQFYEEILELINYFENWFDNNNNLSSNLIKIFFISNFPKKIEEFLFEFIFKFETSLSTLTLYSPTIIYLHNKNYNYLIKFILLFFTNDILSCTRLFKTESTLKMIELINLNAKDEEISYFFEHLFKRNTENNIYFILFILYKLFNFNNESINIYLLNILNKFNFYKNINIIFLIQYILKILLNNKTDFYLYFDLLFNIYENINFNFKNQKYNIFLIKFTSKEKLFNNNLIKLFKKIPLNYYSKYFEILSKDIYLNINSTNLIKDKNIKINDEITLKFYLNYFINSIQLLIANDFNFNYQNYILNLINLLNNFQNNYLFEIIYNFLKLIYQLNKKLQFNISNINFQFLFNCNLENINNEMKIFFKEFINFLKLNNNEIELDILLMILESIE